MNELVSNTKENCSYTFNIPNLTELNFNSGTDEAITEKTVEESATEVLHFHDINQVQNKKSGLAQTEISPTESEEQIITENISNKEEDHSFNVNLAYDDSDAENNEISENDMTNDQSKLPSTVVTESKDVHIRPIDQKTIASQEDVMVREKEMTPIISVTGKPDSEQSAEPAEVPEDENSQSTQIPTDGLPSTEKETAEISSEEITSTTNTPVVSENEKSTESPDVSESLTKKPQEEGQSKVTETSVTINLNEESDITEQPTHENNEKRNSNETGVDTLGTTDTPIESATPEVNIQPSGENITEQVTTEIGVTKAAVDEVTKPIIHDVVTEIQSSQGGLGATEEIFSTEVTPKKEVELTAEVTRYTVVTETSRLAEILEVEKRRVEQATSEITPDKQSENKTLGVEEQNEAVAERPTTEKSQGELKLYVTPNLKEGSGQVKPSEDVESSGEPENETESNDQKTEKPKEESSSEKPEVVSTQATETSTTPTDVYQTYKPDVSQIGISVTESKQPTENSEGEVTDKSTLSEKDHSGENQIESPDIPAILVTSKTPVISEPTYSEITTQPEQESEITKSLETDSEHKTSEEPNENVVFTVSSIHEVTSDVTQHGDNDESEYLTVFKSTQSPTIISDLDEVTEKYFTSGEVTVEPVGFTQLYNKQSEYTSEYPEPSEECKLTEKQDVKKSESTVTEEDNGIPDERSCLVDGQTYKNNSNVPPFNQCQLSCKCVSSILQCESVHCMVPPCNSEDCMPVFRSPGSCCSTYSSIPSATSVIKWDNHIFEKTTTDQKIEKRETTSQSARDQASVATITTKHEKEEKIPESFTEKESEEPMPLLDNFDNEIPDEHVEELYVIPEHYGTEGCSAIGSQTTEQAISKQVETKTKKNSVTKSSPDGNEEKYTQQPIKNSFDGKNLLTVTEKKDLNETEGTEFSFATEIIIEIQPEKEFANAEMQVL
nr:mucin-17-like [Leptinotarsa decemlineata]